MLGGYRAMGRHSPRAREAHVSYRLRATAGCAVLAFSIGACGGDSTAPPPPGQLRVEMHDVFGLPLIDSMPARAGTGTTVYAALLDASGQAVPSTTIEWSVGAGSGSVGSFRTHEFSASGWHTDIWTPDPAPGVQALTAADSGKSGAAVTVHFQVMSNPDAITLSVVGPASFTVQLQQAAPQPLQVVALGPNTAPLPAANVLFYAPDDVTLNAAAGTAVVGGTPGALRVTSSGA